MSVVARGRTRALPRVCGVQRRGVRPAGFGRCAAPRTGEGAVEVPLARVAIVHDAGRLDSGQVTFLGVAVKVV
ncbi:hypothetical protein G6048_18950 [Streptomyces sp. YC419]|uniref:Uncharacterized protein n=1 Tax=Streptomyces ureilyticus TaxID=1775131 RepID=A0ABX0DU01_9ACTN|nr:hypothetical protein [Streptomyces ureilyticus]